MCVCRIVVAPGLIAHSMLAGSLVDMSQLRGVGSCRREGFEAETRVAAVDLNPCGKTIHVLGLF